MTPQEKAKELVEKFQDITALKVTLDEETTVKEIINHAKQCALICVDEKMNFLESIEHQIDVDNYYFLYKELKYEKEQIDKL